MAYIIFMVFSRKLLNIKKSFRFFDAPSTSKMISWVFIHIFHKISLHFLYTYEYIYFLKRKIWNVSKILAILSLFDHLHKHCPTYFNIQPPTSNYPCNLYLTSTLPTPVRSIPSEDSLERDSSIMDERTWRSQ